MNNVLTERTEIMRAYIIGFIRTYGQVNLSALADEFSADEKTILYYLRPMVREGLLHKVQPFTADHSLGRVYAAGPCPYGEGDDPSEPLQITIHRWEPQRPNPTLLEALFFSLNQGAIA
jgi:hypothetical protein